MTTLTGYDPDIRFYATRYNQGGRTVYSVDLSLTQIAQLLPAPDPANPVHQPNQFRRMFYQLTPRTENRYSQPRCEEPETINFARPRAFLEPIDLKRKRSEPKKEG